MSESIQRETCGTCRFHITIPPIQTPFCYGLPPNVYESGSKNFATKRPQTPKCEPGCSLWESVKEGETGTREKAQADTPGDAAKSAHAMANEKSKGPKKK